MKTNKRMIISLQEMLMPAIYAILAGVALMSAVVLPARADIDGEHGLLHIEGELTDSPCRLSMDSADQTVDLGTLATADFSSSGRKSEPRTFVLHLLDCLPASGHIRNEYTSNETFGVSQPVVKIVFTAPADPVDPSLIKLQGVRGIGLRLLDAFNRDVHPGAYEVSHILTPGDNQLIMKVAAERTNDSLIPGAFAASVDFRLSYE